MCHPKILVKHARVQVQVQQPKESQSQHSHRSCVSSVPLVTLPDTSWELQTIIAASYSDHPITIPYQHCTGVLLLLSDMKWHEVTLAMERREACYSYSYAPPQREGVQKSKRAAPYNQYSQRADGRGATSSGTSSAFICFCLVNFLHSAS